jgi:hypothetical protein
VKEWCPIVNTESQEFRAESWGSATVHNPRQ